MQNLQNRTTRDKRSEVTVSAVRFYARNGWVPAAVAVPYRENYNQRMERYPVNQGQHEHVAYRKMNWVSWAKG